MNIALACDHRGYNIKQQLIEQLRVEGHGVEDFGAFDPKACDYPDFAVPASLAIVEGRAQLAILLDGSGIGMSIVANKVPGIRAAICHDELTAEISRRYNDANVLCLAVDLLGGELIRRIVSAWLKAPFEDGRHARRVEKIGELEQRLFSDIPGALSRLKSN
jgi:ribose 5-phosphate isomerase B